jgi:hypothetical protein
MQTWEQYIDAQEDSHNPGSNKAMAEAFGYFAEGPGRMNRGAYKYTDCGASVGFRILHVTQEGPEGDPSGEGHEDWVERWYYGSEALYKWGTWQEMTDNFAVVTGFTVNTIVEGSDNSYSGEVISVDPRAPVTSEYVAYLEAEYGKAVQACEDHAEEVWQEMEWQNEQHCWEDRDWAEGEAWMEYEDRQGSDPIRDFPGNERV